MVLRKNFALVPLPIRSAFVYTVCAMEYEIKAPILVIEAAQKLFPDSSKRTLRAWIKNGRFWIEGKPPLFEKTLLQKGEKLLCKEAFRPPRKIGFDILYEERYFIVIDKPVGLLSVPLEGEKEGKNALSLLRKHFQSEQIFAVHRLDQKTSGVLLFARGKEAEKRFRKLFEKRQILKEYHAIVEGNLREDKGTWESRLLELPSYRVIEAPQGKRAITHFTTLKRSDRYSYLKLQLETGKKHQIRVQCQTYGHPVVGDKLYGSNANPIQRLGLHAHTLGVTHPFTGKNLLFSSPLPESFKKFSELF